MLNELAETFRNYQNGYRNRNQHPKKLYLPATTKFCALFLMILKVSSIFLKMGQKWLIFLEIIKMDTEIGISIQKTICTR